MQFDKFDQLDQIDQLDQLDQFDQFDQFDHFDQFDQFDQKIPAHLTKSAGTLCSFHCTLLNSFFNTDHV